MSIALADALCLRGQANWRRYLDLPLRAKPAHRCGRSAPSALVALAVLSSSFGLLRADDATDSILRDVMPAIQSRIERLEFVDLRFISDITEDPQFLRPQSKAAPVRHYVLQGSYARRAEKFKSWSDNTRPNPGQTWTDNFHLYNGELMIVPSNAPNTYLISKNRAEMYSVLPPWKLADEPDLWTTLQSWKVDRAKITRIAHTSATDGNESVVEYEFQFSSGWKSRCRFVPARNYCLRQVESFNEHGQLVYRAHVDSYLSIGGESFPESGWRREFFPDGRLGREVKFQVQSMKIGRGNVPDSMFEFEFPPEALIWDQDMQVWVRRTGQTQSHLDQLVENAGHRRGLWRKWIWIAAPFVVLLLVALLIIRRRSQRAARTPA
jgi:hypothetical protein